MGLRDEYEALRETVEQIEQKEKDKKRLKAAYEKRYKSLKQVSSMSHSEWNNQALQLAAEWWEKDKQLTTEIKDLMKIRDESFKKTLFVRIGNLREELADYLGIDVNEVLLSLRLITYNSPVNHTIDEEDKEYKKYLSEKAILNICVSPPYPKNLKNIDYDIKDSFVYKLDFNMPQADGISLIDHMYKEIELPNCSEKM